MSGYRDAIVELVSAEAKALVPLGLTQKPAAQPIVRFQPGEARGVAVLVHGFSAGPAQWLHAVEPIFARGFDVFAPALPGHGIVRAGGSEDTTLLPDLAHPAAWDACADRLWGALRTAPNVTLIGFSAGAVLAFRIAERQREDVAALRRIVAVSPFFAPAGELLALGPLHVSNRRVAGWLEAIADHAGAAHRLLARVRMDLGPNVIDYGFRFASQSQIIALTRFGASAMREAGDLAKVPVQLIVSESDTRADTPATLAVAKRIGAPVWLFPAALGVRHAVISPRENPDSESVDKVQDIILRSLS